MEVTSWAGLVIARFHYVLGPNCGHQAVGPNSAYLHSRRAMHVRIHVCLRRILFNGRRNPLQRDPLQWQYVFLGRRSIGLHLSRH